MPLSNYQSRVFDNYIDGEFVAPISGNYFPVYEPASGQPYAQCADSDKRDVSTAAKAAKNAFGLWSNTPTEQRSRILLRIAQLIEEYLPELAAAETQDTGKPIALSKQIDIPRAAANFHFFGTALMHYASESHHTEGIGALNYTLRRPIGVVGCISPWNLPLYLFSWKIAPALAAGNCVVGKPSEVTPRTAYLLAEICHEAGLPAGVLNIVQGVGEKAGRAIVSNEGIKAISFTGSTRAGREIARIAAPMFKKLSLELGGKNPNIVFADCDFEQMMQTTLRSSFSNQGQICLCGSRIYIEKPLYEKFKTEFVRRTKALRLDNPNSPETQIGAVVSEQHLHKILSCIDLAGQEEGQLLCGGKQAFLDGEWANGWYVEPTIIESLPQNCRTDQEEIFGPVVSIAPFETEEEAVALANQTEYGLSASIWTQNLTRAHRLAEQIDCGIVWINCWLLRDLRTPFGGTKQSGIGREGGWEAMRFFTEPKNVCIKL